MNYAHNKAFKRDSCRVAFLVCGGFSGESGLRKVGLCGIHPLTQRYVNTVNSEQLRENNNDRFYSW
ncbi:DUF3265 domain-containing protein [Vibrio parahaemolyticus]|nr:DUF3265 domain-containing protein [Vibrio parahaemolyticus]MCI9697120.1 DUF3265 domain-containing protein [Vibrio parahaemolyticus]MCI9711723.1 DUF3265 domain-containing protein [Vibrio parahaemolyticus]MCI9716593.1 DUF3265 domain-containing protein [Vibrio parahaemolyticus]MCR9945001.1 DUF3265 domain-containing protein [Vibrio parahaemolyticus]MCS0011783.1 DUF3265 domain-containing protein [Vibrio parahaemolyticus]